MNKLDEIEADLRTMEEVDWEHAYADLLIRAVRQLGNLDVHLMGRARALKEGLLDPDVLELLEKDSQ